MAKLSLHHLTLSDQNMKFQGHATTNLQITGEGKFPNLEWKYVMQIRFRVGGAKSDTDRVVDGDLFELGKRHPPIVLRIGDENIRRIRIEMKVIETVRFTYLFKSDDLHPRHSNKKKRTTRNHCIFII